jgi:hypothetical protein
MKFGKLLTHTLIDVPDWPQIRYKEFKRRLNKRQTVERQHSLFATGEFKRALREDLQRINTFWLTKEAAFHETPPEPEAVQLLLRWLTINYLAVLKITKKHDKRCDTALLDPIAKVLITQPFVRGLTTSSLFAKEQSATASSASSPLPSEEEETPEQRKRWQPFAGPASSRQALIVELLGDSATRYFPETLLQRVASSHLDEDFLLADEDSDNEETGAAPKTPKKADAATKQPAKSGRLAARIAEKDEELEDSILSNYRQLQDFELPEETPEEAAAASPDRGVIDEDRSRSDDPNAWLRALLSSLVVLALSLYVGTRCVTNCDLKYEVDTGMVCA